MASLQNFLNNMNWEKLLFTLFSLGATLICLTVHELCHGAAAYCLGDPTAKAMGRLSPNPIRHIDWYGLLLMVTVGVGWAKPVPVDMRQFRRPKRDMAVTALAGPVSNFLLAWVFMLIARLLLTVLPFTSQAQVYLLYFFILAALRSVGLGVFNLIPIPPLDGSRVLFAFLPDRIYMQILRYERYITVALLVLLWWGVLSGPVSFCVTRAARGLAALSGLPQYFF